MLWFKSMSVMVLLSKSMVLKGECMVESMNVMVLKDECMVLQNK